ncbi:hypothetical protein D9M70_563640 [compost metagenome]
MRKQVELLEDEADVATHLVDVDILALDVGSVDMNCSRADFLQAVHGANQCGLTGAGRTAQDYNLTPLDLGADVSKDMVIAVPLFDAAQLDDWVCLGRCGRRIGSLFHDVQCPAAGSWEVLIRLGVNVRELRRSRRASITRTA